MSTITMPGQPANDQRAFEIFADAYPHEAFDRWPNRFIEYAMRQAPHCTRDEIVALLEETRGEDTEGKP